MISNCETIILVNRMMKMTVSMTSFDSVLCENIRIILIRILHPELKVGILFSKKWILMVMFASLIYFFYFYLLNFDLLLFILKAQVLI